MTAASGGERRHDDEESRVRFAELYREYYPKVLGYARRRTSSPAAAEDIVASTFMVAWRRIDTYLGADAPLAWLYGVAYRTLLSHYRGERARLRLTAKVSNEFPVISDAPDVTAEGRENLAAVVAALNRLSATDQELLLLAGWEDLDHDDLAVVLDIARPLIRSRLYRARRRLEREYQRLLNSTDEGRGVDP